MKTKKLLTGVYITLGFLFFVAVALFGFGLYLDSLSKTLPDLEAQAHKMQLQERSRIYAANGALIAEVYGEEDRQVVPLEKVSKITCEAVVAIEDKRFYEHSGIDPRAITRALGTNIEAGGIEQGGSTITQQVVKLLYTDQERTLSRKVKEALMALSLETQLDKDTVLETYLNTAYFGHGAYGIESAANRFFDKSANDLTLSEAALLAGCIQRPSKTDPFANPDLAFERRNVVLGELKNQNYITEKQYRDAVDSPLGLKPPQEDAEVIAPYFVEYTKRELVKALGSERFYRGGLDVYTTLDLDAQNMAEQAAATILPDGNDPEAAIASIRYSDGAVLALVGGRDFEKDHFDISTQGHRQTGSAFKPFVLAAALENGYTLNSSFDASPYETKVKDEVWKVENYENSITSGSYTLLQATTYSINTIYARLVMAVGPESVVDVAHRMGIESELNADPAIALGGLSTGVCPLEMASAFGTIAGNGYHVKPSPILEVVDSAGATIYQPDRAPEQVISAGVASTLDTALRSVYTQGTGTAANCGRVGAVKTGTSQSWCDAWTVGYSGDIATAVWVGYREGMVPMTDVKGIRVAGGTYPAQVWSLYMRNQLDIEDARRLSSP